MSTNISLYCVPIAWMLALSPRGYSVYAFTKFSKSGRRTGPTAFRTPRTFKDIVAADTSIPPLQRGRIVRAESASLNGLENLGFFAAAVAVGNTAVALRDAGPLDVTLLNRLAVAYLVSRALYNVVFIRNETTSHAFTRMGLFLFGISVNVTLFIMAGLMLNG